MDKLLRPDRFNGTLDTTPAEWNHWFRTFTNFLDSLPAYPAPDKLKLLVNHVSPSVYSHISDCTTYNEAITILKTVFVKPTNVVFARHLLATRKQTASETVDQFLHALKLLSKDCEFKAVSADTYTQEAIRDSFISGIYSPIIRQRLLEKESLTLPEAVQLAQSLDSAQRNAEVYVAPVPANQTSAAATTTVASSGIDSGASGMDIGTLQAGEDPGTAAAVSKLNGTSVCYFCGRASHPRPRCPARNTVCYKCGRKGHFAIVCKSTRGAAKHRPTSASTSVLDTMATSNFSAALTNYGQETAATTSSISLAAANPPHHATIPVRVNNVSVKALIDSGSTSSFLHPDIVEQLAINTYPSQDNIVMASSHISKTLGHCFVNLDVQNNSYTQFKLSVLPGLCAKVILGEDFMQLHESVNFDLKGPRPSLTVSGVTCVTCMKIDPPSLFPYLTEDCKPVSTHTRRFSKLDQKFIQEEVKSLLKEGVIESIPLEGTSTGYKGRAA